MKNVAVLAKWIGGHYYNCDFRPIPLCEYLVNNVPVLFVGRLMLERDHRYGSSTHPTIVSDSTPQNGRPFIKLNRLNHSRKSPRRTLRPNFLFQQNDDS
jgi:hypothetical protein